MPRKILYLRFPLVFFLFLPVSLLLGQLDGIVRDMESGIPLPGAQIKSAGEITVSGEDGMFSITAPPGSMLHISHIGYLSDSLQVRAAQPFVTVFLSPAAYRLNEVVVRSPLLHDKQMSMPSSIAVLNPRDLDRSDKLSYIEKLNQLSGVYVHKGSMSTSRITVRGMGARTPYASNRIKAYYNEIPLSSGDGSTLIEDIDPDFIQSISLIKGAKSAMYGSGIGGVLLLSGKSYFKEGISGGLALEGGSFNTLKPNASIHYRKNDFSLSSGYSFVHSDGFRENSAYDRHNAHLYLSLNKKNLELSLLLHFIDVHAFIPSSLDEETFNSSPEKSAANWLSVKGFESYSRMLSGLKSRYFLSAELSNTTVIYGNFLNAYESRPFNILDDQSMQLGLKSYFTYKNGGLILRSGVDYLHESYHWSIYETLGGDQGRELNRFRETRHPLSVFYPVRSAN
jgi:iron complex outermembrane receptor protein